MGLLMTATIDLQAVRALLELAEKAGPIDPHLLTKGNADFYAAALDLAPAMAQWIVEHEGDATKYMEEIGNWRSQLEAAEAEVARLKTATTLPVPDGRTH